MDMRGQLTDGNPSAPLLIHVGRLGAEKNLFVLKDILHKIPGAHLAFVGDGPSRKQLQEHFADMPNVKFMVRALPLAANSCLSSSRQYSIYTHPGTDACLCVEYPLSLPLLRFNSLSMLKLRNTAKKSCNTR